jgi:hypothetical protein
MTEMIGTNILNPGIKFIVLDEPKDGAFPPGTTGFMGCLRGSENRRAYVYNANVTIIRKGKGGKDRIDTCSLNTPVFLTEEMQNNKAYLEVLPMGSKYYVHIRTVPMESNLLEMSNLDFIGWSGAYNQYIQHLIGFSNHGYRWPEDKSDPLNTTAHLSDKWANDPVGLLDLFSSNEYRIKVVNTIRKAEASLIRCVSTYQFKLTQTIKSAAIQMIRLVEEYGDGVADVVEMKRVIEYLDRFEGVAKSKKTK